MSVLPERPSLEHLRKQAKARRRERGIALSQAQHQLAREYGFASWPKLAHVIQANCPAWSARQLRPVDVCVQEHAVAVRDAAVPLAGRLVASIFDCRRHLPRPHHLLGRSTPFTFAQPSAHLSQIGSVLTRHITDWTDVPPLDFRI